MQAPRGVLAEHQVLAVGEGEGLLVGAFHGGLQRGAEAGFGAVDQRLQRQSCQVRGQLQMQVCRAALAMWRGDDAVAAAEPGTDFRVIEGAPAEVAVKACLDQLSGQCCGAGAGR
ncbi:hypothetical protein D9M71_600550 [compost metagenome]